MGGGRGSHSVCPGQGPPTAPAPEFIENLSFSPTLALIFPVVGVELETWGHLLPWAVPIHFQDHPLPTSSDLPRILGMPTWAAAPGGHLDHRGIQSSETSVFMSVYSICFLGGGSVPGARRHWGSKVILLWPLALRPIDTPGVW